LVCDLIYAPRETLLLRQARQKGLAAMNGLPLLVCQAALSFELFTGQAPDQKDIAELINRL
jgi:shikimate dehydrogenase